MKRRGRRLMGGWAIALVAAHALVGHSSLPRAVAEVSPPSGSLDLSFDGDGKVLTRLSDTDQANATAIQPDGRIVVAGFSEQGATGRDFTVLRYNADGSLDPTFGGDGVATASFGSGPSRDEAFAVALQPDGRIVVAGETWENGTTITHTAVARYDADGSLDPTFGGDGTVVVPMGTKSAARAVAVRPDGRILVAGGMTTLSGGVGLWVGMAQLTPDGALDPTFASGGVVQTTVGNSSVVNAAVLQPDGRIVLAGRMQGGSTTYMIVLRYTASGTPDQSFSGGNVQTQVGFASVNIALALAVAPDGGIVVGGFSNVSGFQMVVMRHRSTGGLDPSFDGDGIVTHAMGGFGQAFAVAVDGNGRTLVAGDAAGVGNRDIGLIRYQLNGALDPTFGTGGVVKTDVGGGGNHGRALTIQADDRIVVAGYDTASFTGGMNVVRYNGDDTIPPETTITVGPLDLTRDATPTFEFSTDEAGSTFACSMDGAAFEACSTPHTTALLDDGTHTFAVRASDLAGNTDATPAARSFTVDTTPPDTVITSGPPAVSTDDTPTFSFVSSEAGSAFACRVDADAAAPCVSPHTTTALPNGTHTFAVDSTDPAGNVDPSPATVSFRVCTGQASEAAVAADNVLRPISPALADQLLDRLCG